ncbi:MAG: inositol monophosphatase [Rhodospirillales bacterium]|jgi:inositol-phosphate phosphatase / L-galactose 1-phosphate phosphatase / histidinol-phosphatase|nr:inositol monophosphatase [Rhodospirillales bacterium]MBT4039663.1 inositol monophosphatase [Rhodospirillales bacterium]MBT4626441.1 inositol monophosphatase [Rhodospirillales bacterium]MBT5350876.1 inositol monophosphatase [Rhodospirillales bacterium]MBT5520685.1 inositol monophosphatase [Rhodospirillales bacterium]
MAYNQFIEAANSMADASGAVIRAGDQKSFQIVKKGDGSPVTSVDQATEDRVRDIISEAFPDHGIVGEERDDHAPDSEFVWVLDPIDGTLPFLAGIPVYGTLIALLHQKRPVLGVIDMPMTGDRWIGCEGMPTTRNGEPCRTRSCADLSDAMMSTSNPDYYDESNVSALEQMRDRSNWNVYGGSCMAYAQIASGRIDVGMDVLFDVHDYMALVPVIQGAGGIISDWSGKALDLNSGDRFVAAGDARVHEQALEILSAI